MATIIGTNGDDTLTGGTGNDTLNGGFGVDSMAGGLGDDVYYADWTIRADDESPSGVTAYYDTVIELPGEGIDMIVGYALAPNVENLTMLNTGQVYLIPHYAYDNELDNLIIGNDWGNTVYSSWGRDTLALGKGDDQYHVSPDAIVFENAGEGTDRVYAGSGYHLPENVEELFVSGVGFGNAQANSIYGSGVDDLLMGGGGDDQLSGRAGDDTLIGGTGHDALFGGAGDDAADFSGSDHALTSADGKLDGDSLVQIERIIGSSFGDTFILGNNAVALIDGGAGNDSFLGAAVARTYLGGAGNDSFAGGSAGEIFVGGTGGDSINGGGGIDTADYSAATTAVTVNLALAGPQNTGNGTGIDTLSNIENLTGGSVRDNLTGDGLDNVLLGLNGNDVLAGGAGNDTLDGSNSNDTLHGDAGDDRLIGGYGSDLMNGGAGIDTADYAGDGLAVNVNLTKTTAQDTGHGTDTLSGIENLIAGAGNDGLVGSTAANLIRAGAGNDGLVGLGGADSLYGEDGDDMIQGGAGNDLLIGDAGADELVGGAGNDTLAGGAAADELVGGADADTFLYNAISETAVGPLHDTIGDFEASLDRIGLSAIDANVLVSGDQAFTFIGGAAFSRAAAQLRQDSDGAGNTVIEGDVQGDGVADFQILLNGAYTFTGLDFFL